VRDARRDLRDRSESLLLLDARAQSRGAHGERRLPRDHREDLEVALAEHAGLSRIEVDHADEDVVVKHRHGHRSAHACGHHARRAPEPLVEARIAGDEPHTLGHHLGEDAARQHDGIAGAVAPKSNARDELAGALVQENRAALRRHEREGSIEYRAQHPIDVVARGEQLTDLERDLEPRVIALGRDRFLDGKPVLDDVRVVGNGDLNARACRIAILEAQPRGAHDDLVAIGEHDLRDARTVHERAVRRTEVTDEEAALVIDANFRVPARNERVGDHVRRGFVAAESHSCRELEPQPLRHCDPDERCHYMASFMSFGAVHCWSSG
jgi:hypothetical protein